MSTSKLKAKLRDRTPGYDGRPPDLRVRRIGAEEHGFNILLNTNSAPLEWLVNSGRLEGKKDPAGRALVRTSAGQAIRSLFQGAEISPLKSVSMEPSTRQAGVKLVSDHQIDCMNALDRLKRTVPVRDLEILRRVCFEDFWYWDVPVKREKRRRISEVNRCLDLVALALGMLTRIDYTKRWRRQPGIADVAKSKAADTKGDA
ncbi:MAG: hypothetical protein CML31_05405 [Rhizobiales bacterium]|nr:hypothetical protein [Hoeflea sp.]MBG19390.1 hypothetical protein [Hyphomicrobiales bacterium]|tara:strand:+ start:13033 stop:13638 length:606 start_codon:yes stop_codon:yes gene_type:complete